MTKYGDHSVSLSGDTASPVSTQSIITNSRLGKNLIKRALSLVNPRSCRLSLQMHRAIVLVGNFFLLIRLTNQGEAWHGMCPQSVRDLFSENSTGYNFRGAGFHIPRFHPVTYGEHSLRCLAPKLWNSLQKNVRNLPSLQSFKCQTRLVNLSLKLESDCENCVLCSNWHTNWPIKI